MCYAPSYIHNTRDGALLCSKCSHARMKLHTSTNIFHAIHIHESVVCANVVNGFSKMYESHMPHIMCMVPFVMYATERWKLRLLQEEKL